MSQLIEQLKADIKTAMRAREREKLSTLRMLHSNLKNKRIDEGKDLSDDDVVAVMAKAVKQRKESAEAYEEGGRQELADKERREIEWIRAYLPEPLSDDEAADLVAEVIEDTGASSRADMGRVMGTIVPKIKGRYDASKIKDIVLEQLS